MLHEKLRFCIIYVDLSLFDAKMSKNESHEVKSSDAYHNKNIVTYKIITTYNYGFSSVLVPFVSWDSSSACKISLTDTVCIEKQRGLHDHRMCWRFIFRSSTCQHRQGNKSIGDDSRLLGAFMERASRVCKNHERSVANFHSICMIMSEDETNFYLRTIFKMKQRTKNKVSLWVFNSEMEFWNFLPWT